MDCNTLIGIIEEAGYSAYSYSGRGMYGDKCVGFTTSVNEFITAVNLIRAAIFLDGDENDLPHEMMDTLETVKTDNMGLDTVVYFPRVKWEED